MFRARKISVIEIGIFLPPTLSMFRLVGLLLFSVYGSTALQSRQPDAHVSLISSSFLTEFNVTSNGRLTRGVPLAEPCYSNYNNDSVTPNPSKCTIVEAGYDNSTFIAQNFGGYQNVNWGMCQITGQRCVLNFSAPAAPVSPSSECYQGSVPYAYFAPGNVSDVQNALHSARSSGVPLVIKNSGHDYKGRSSAPNSLALWMYPYQKPITLAHDFIPEGCSSPVGRLSFIYPFCALLNILQGVELPLQPASRG
jgi:hypothetical protein